MTLLSLRLLGPFKAHYQGRPLSAFRTKATQALLIYLAVQTEQPHGRRRQNHPALGSGKRPRVSGPPRPYQWSDQGRL
jgi:hypothetical protein